MQNDDFLKVNQEPTQFKLLLKSLSQSSRGGIYVLHCFENEKPRTIHRLFGHDTKGILYIGMTEGSLVNRVGALQQSLVDNANTDEKEPAHSGHTQMGKKYFRIRKKIDIDSLYIQVFPHENPKQAETDALENYVKEYAELPPLNGQYGSFDPEWSIFT